MGWTSEATPRSGVVARKKAGFTTAEGGKVETLKHHATPKADWFLSRHTDPNDIVSTFIWVMIWDGNFHKEMDEACGPYHYGCPLEWFDVAPLPPYGYAAEFRERNRRAALGLNN